MLRICTEKLIQTMSSEVQGAVVEWQGPCLVAHQTISGWQMFFRVELGSEGEYTLDHTFRPSVEWGLKRVCRRGLRREGIF